MPITVSHVLSMTTPNSSQYECQPQHWNSGHAITFTPAGSEISGAFSNANGVSFGLSGTAVTASYTVPAATVFSNSNGVSFGLNGSTITASYTVPGATVFSNSNNVSFGLNGSTVTATATVPAQTNQTVGLYASGNTTAQASSSTLDARTLSIRGAGVASVGFSAGEVIISVPSGGGVGDGGVGLSAGANTISAGTVVFSNSNGLSFGLNGSTVTASHNGLTTAALSNHSHGNPTLALTNISGTTASASNGLTLSLSVAPPGNGEVVALSAGTQSVSTGTVAFSNSNGISFGMSGSNVITASHNGLTTAALSNHSHGNPTLALTNISGTTASASNGLTLSLSAAPAAAGVGISAGTQSVSTGTMVFSNSNGVSFGMSGSSRITASVAAPALSGSNGSFSFLTATFGNLNGLSFYSSNGSIVGSYTAPDIGTLSAGTSIATLGQILIADSNGISFGASNNTITASYNPFGGGISGGNTAGNTGTVASRLFLAGGANITLSGSSNGGSITVSVVGGAGGNGAGLSAGTQSVSTGTVVFSNSNGISFGMSGSSRITASYTVPGATVFSNSNNVSFGLNGSTVTATATFAQTNQTLGLYGVSNTTLSSSGTVDARTLSFQGAGAVSVGVSNGSVIISGGAGGQTNQSLGLYAIGNTTQNSSSTFDARTLSFNALGAMTAGFSNGSIQLSAPPVSSLSATGILSISTNGSTISLGVPGGTCSFWSPYDNPQTTASQIGHGSVFVQPMFNVHGNLSLTRFDLFASMAISSSTNSSHAGALSFGVGIYTRNGSTLSLATSGSQSYQWTNTSNNSLASVSGLRRFSIPVSANIVDGADYWIAFQSRSATTNANWFTASNARITAMTDLVQGLMGEASNATKQLLPGFGLWSTTSAALPASIALGDIRGHGTGVANNALPVFVNANNFTA